MNPTAALIHYLAGALTLAFLLAGVHFLRFWRRTRDRLFLAFAVAFWLLALNQILTTWTAMSTEHGGAVYLLRVLGFGLILLAIVDKNAGRPPRS